MCTEQLVTFAFDCYPFESEEKREKKINLYNYCVKWQLVIIVCWL